ncbi:MAG: DNA mismatch repair protein MutS, partial [Bacteroidota bacterium]
ELFKGTNTIERVGAAHGILAYLNQGPHLVFLSTHDLELADLLADGYELYHFRDDIREATLHFDYTLHPGIIQDTNAIRILALSDYPEAVVDQALETVEKGKSQKQ